MRAVIIGGGLIGLSIGYYLIKNNVEVFIFDKDHIGKGASWVAGGMIAPQSESLEEGTFLDFCLESRELYKQFIQDIENDTNVDTGYWQCGILKLAFTEGEKERLIKDIKRYEKLGLKSTFLSKEELKHKYSEIGEEVLCGVLYEDDAQVDNRKLVSALSKYIKQKAKVYEFEEVNEIIVENGKFKAIKTDKHIVYADICILSAGAWSGKFGIPVRPLKGEMAALDITEKDIDRVLYSSRAYLIPRKDYHRLVIGATQEDIGFKDGNTAKGAIKLLQGAVDTLRNLKDKNIQELWFGYRPTTPDYLPILGEGQTKGVIYATGHHRNGILLAPITAKVITEYILNNKKSKYLEEFSPNRFSTL